MFANVLLVKVNLQLLLQFTILLYKILVFHMYKNFFHILLIILEINQWSIFLRHRFFNHGLVIGYGL